MIRANILNVKSKLSGKDFSKEYDDIIQIRNTDELLLFQKDCLNKLLLHAHTNVPYYNKVLRKISLISNKEVDLSKFNVIPILTKDVIRKKFQSLLSKDYTSRKWFYNSSGGSTGEPLRFVQDEVYTKWRNATDYFYYNNILEIDKKIARKVILWGSERDILKNRIGLRARLRNWLSNTIYLNGFKMGEEDISRYIKIINSYKPDIIRGYSSSLHELSRFAEKNKIGIYKPKIIIGAAETIESNMRNKIESVFGTKLYDFYGSREVSSIAGECRRGLKHIFSFWNYVEVLDENDVPIKVGEEGRIVITNLFNYSMPLIRYEIGDFGILGPEKCQCGNILPTFEKVTGRITDRFILRDGRIIPPEFFIHLIGVVHNRGFVKRFQVIQEDFQKIRIMIVLKRNMYDYEKKAIEDDIKLLMGEDCVIVWDIVDEISNTSGKFIYTKSLVWNKE